MDIEKAYGWDTAPLGELLEFYIGGDWGKDPEFEDDAMELAYCIRGSEIRNWNENKGNTASLRKIKKTNVAKRKLVVDDILVEISGGGPEQPVGRTVLIDKTALSFEPAVPKICTNFLRLIRPKGSINSKFLDLYLKFFYNSGEIIKYQNGSNNLRNLIFPEFLKIEIPFPAPDEQHEIVEKIEELFSELDKGIENLKTAQQQLKVYRQAVLKWAFEGKLTNDNVKDGELPEGWKVELLGNVSDSCLGKMLDRNKNKGTPAPYLRNINVRWNAFNLEDLFEMPFESKESERYGLKNGDLVICEGGEPGRAAIWKNQMPGMKIQKALHRVRFNKNVEPVFFLYYLNWIASTKKIDKYFTGTTIKHLTGQSLKKITFPLPLVEEQQRILFELESRLSVCDKMEETITTSLQQAEALRQSILKKAFEGKLIN